MTPLPSIDKTVLEIVSLEDADRLDREYWRSQTPEERLRAMEVMRQIAYNYDPTERLQRVLEIASLDALEQ